MVMTRVGGKLKWFLAAVPLLALLLISCKTPGDYSSLGSSDAQQGGGWYFRLKDDYASTQAVRKEAAEFDIWRELPQGLDREDVEVSCEICENNPTCHEGEWECTMGIPEAFDGFKRDTYTNQQPVRLFGPAENQAFQQACAEARRELSAKLGRPLTENTTEKEITGRHINGVQCRLGYNVFVGSDEQYKGKEKELARKLGLTSSGPTSTGDTSSSGGDDFPQPPKTPDAPTPPIDYARFNQSYGQGSYCESADLLQTGFYRLVREACKAGKTLNLNSSQIPRDCRNLDGYVIMRNVFNKDRAFTEGLTYIKSGQEVPGCRPLTIEYKR